MLQLEVHQFITTALTPTILSAQDDFTDPKNLIFSIKSDRLSGKELSSLYIYSIQTSTVMIAMYNECI